MYESELEGIAATTNIILEATNNITIADLTDNNLNLAQTAGNSVTFTADSDSDGTGDFSMNTGDTITTAGGNLTISANAVTLGTISTGAGTFSITADAVAFRGVTAGALTVDVSGGVGTISQLGGNLTIAGATSLTAQIGDNITLNTATNDFGGAVSIVSGNNVVLYQLQIQSI